MHVVHKPICIVVHAIVWNLTRIDPQRTTKVLVAHANAPQFHNRYYDIPLVALDHVPGIGHTRPLHVRGFPKQWIIWRIKY